MVTWLRVLGLVTVASCAHQSTAVWQEPYEPPSLSEWQCPVPARDPLPHWPSVPYAVISRDFGPCLTSCQPSERLRAVLEVSRKGEAGRPKIGPSITGCFKDAAVQRCIGELWSKLCFEPSRKGLQGLSFEIAADPEAWKVFAPRERSVSSKGGTRCQAAPGSLERVDPIYPRVAAVKGIEGFVIVGIDVAPSGEVKNARVLASEPAGVFNRAVMEAVSGWRFKPQCDAQGKPIWKRGLKIMMPFRLR